MKNIIGIGNKAARKYVSKLDLMNNENKYLNPKFNNKLGICDKGYAQNLFHSNVELKTNLI
mgnify:CR=1 FL=1